MTITVKVEPAIVPVPPPIVTITLDLESARLLEYLMLFNLSVPELVTNSEKGYRALADLMQDLHVELCRAEVKHSANLDHKL